jgi:hypothetical protein
MDEDFLEVLKSTIESTLAPERLVGKKMNGIEVTGKQFAEYFEQFLSLFQSNTLPEAQSIYDATVEQQHNSLIKSCLDYYKEQLFKNQDLILCDELIPVVHESCKNGSLLKYKNAKKMGNKHHETKHQQKLEQEIENCFLEWKEFANQNVQKIEQEMKKTRQAIREKEKLYEEQINVTKEYAEKLLNVEKQKNQMQQELFEKTKAEIEARLKAEILRREEMEAEKRLEEEYRQKLQLEYGNYKKEKEKSSCLLM